MSCRARRQNTGFTLIEAIIVMVITGILAGAVAVFIAKPVEGYVDAVRRAELTDAADVALRRMTRDIRLALPNSLRIGDSGGTVGACSAGTCYIEFIMTSGGGRYRSEGDGSTAGNILSFASATTAFDVLGNLPANPPIAAGDYIVVYNLGAGYGPANAYDCTATPPGCNRAQVAAAWGGANPVTLTAATQTVFSSQTPPLPSPDSRFQVVPGGTQAVTYACPKSVAGNLNRHWSYGFNATQAAPSGGSSAVLAANATCTIDYASAATGRSGLLYVQLTLTSGGESVTLFQQIHIDNAP